MKILGCILALIHIIPILVFSWLALFNIYEASNLQWVIAFVMAMSVVFVSPALAVSESSHKKGM